MQTVWKLFASPTDNTLCFVFVSMGHSAPELHRVFLKSWVNVGIPELHLDNSPSENNTTSTKVFVVPNVFPGKHESALSGKTEG